MHHRPRQPDTAIEGIRAGLRSMRLGKGKPAHEFFSDLRAKLGLPGKKR